MMKKSNFRRILSALLIGCLVLSLASCASDKKDSIKNEVPTTTGSQENNSPPAETVEISASLILQAAGVSGLSLQKVSHYMGTTAGTSYYSGTPNTAWYTKNKTEYTLTTADQFMGFFKLRSQNTSFAGETIKLGCNIVINQKTVAEMQSAAPAYKNLQINSKYYFCGTFDGQHHTISGAYMEPSASLRGLFGGLGDNAVLKNLTLQDSYFKGVNSSGAGGTAFIAGRAAGTGIVIENVHVAGCTFTAANAIMDGVSAILGRVDGKKDVLIKNCSVDAETVIDLAGNQSTVAAGLVSTVQANGTLVIENTVCSAELRAANIVGGLVGSNAGVVKVDKSSMYNGTILCDGSFYSDTVADGNPIQREPGAQYEGNAYISELKAADWVVYYQSTATERVKLSALALANELSEVLGKTVTAEEMNDSEKYKIMAEKSLPGFYDYRIDLQNGTYYLSGGSSAAVFAAANTLLEHIAAGELSGGAYANDFDYSLFNPLVYDSSAFTPVWNSSITVPAWMTDFEEKIAALFDPDGRPLLMSHGRAGYTYYENTVEDTISNLLLGADILEMDTYHTKDGVIVMSHNATIPAAAANRLELSANPEYPKSLLIADWTFAQLKELNIEKENADGTVSTYKMASLYEILLLLRGRCFLMLDKKDTWIITEDVLELAVETDSAEVFLYSMFLSSASGYTGDRTATEFMAPYLAEHPEAVNMKKWYDIYMKHYTAADGKYPARAWALKEGTSGTGKVFETTADYQRVVNEKGTHVIIWTNEVNKATLFISGNYAPTEK